jgi:hypothetical protein
MRFDEAVRSRKTPFSVIPAKPGSGPGQAPESSVYNVLRKVWTPFFNGVTAFYQRIKFDWYSLCFDIPRFASELPGNLHRS